jgi:beta-glucanase (GH16 family)
MMKFIAWVVIAGCASFNSDQQKEKYTLIWSDEFEKDGAPDSTSWTYDIGRGSNGWGNQELQYYTRENRNVQVKNGVLKITASKENGSWTSARVKSQGKRSFKYGKVVFRAKLPSGVGTWPALWLLGDDIPVKGWPSCGEIDVMEHVGKNPGIVQAALHTPSSHGDTKDKNSIPVPTYNSEFHDYELVWTEAKLQFSVDGKVFYTYAPTEKNQSTWPYDHPFYLIMNVAIGGGFGGAVDESLTTATMEVDYVRVYESTARKKKAIVQH